jgi:ribosomal protein S18 acetylase RimI-like enzyme
MGAAMPGPYRSVDIQLHGPEEAVELAERVWPCYRNVFGDFEDFATWRSDMFDRHAARDGYRLAVGTDDDTVAGFSWGYIGEHGQYWTDLVCQALPASVADEWVGGHFEFVELAVLPAYRCRGLGLRLHDTLLRGICRECLLGTEDDPQDPAVQLYLSRGWRKIGVLRPGVQVLGRKPAQTLLRATGKRPVLFSRAGLLTLVAGAGFEPTASGL